MKKTFLLLLSVVLACVLSSTTIFAGNQLTQKQIKNIAAKAYVYGYPLVLMQTTQRISTNVPAPNTKGFAPVNQLAHMRAFPDHNFKEVIRPNLDTLYSIAWLDLTKEPMVLSVPNMQNRYYMLPMLDAWTNVFSAIGTRTTKDKPQNFVIAGPNWQGSDIPENLTIVKAPTNIVWLIGRTLTKGKADYKTVHKIQDQYQITPLSEWGNSFYKPATHKVDASIDMKTAPVKQVNRMNAITFFQAMAEAMKTNFPQVEDKPVLAEIAKIGLAPGKNFTTDQFNQEQIKALNQGIKSGFEQIKKYAEKDVAIKTNGWAYMTEHVGAYGTNYLARAHIALVGLGANLPQDAVYPMTWVSAEGKMLDAKHKYVIHFNKDELPPVKAFWSLTLYNAKGFLAHNSINRHIIRDRDPLKYNADGSLDIYLQATSPGKAKKANWLPTPQSGKFNLALRLYWPEKSVLDGKWKIPPVTKVN